VVVDTHCSVNAACTGSEGTSEGPWNARSIYVHIALDSNSWTSPWRNTGINPNGLMLLTSGVCGRRASKMHGTPFSMQTMRVVQVKLLCGVPMMCSSGIQLSLLIIRPVGHAWACLGFARILSTASQERGVNAFVRSVIAFFKPSSESPGRSNSHPSRAQGRATAVYISPTALSSWCRRTRPPRRCSGVSYLPDAIEQLFRMLGKIRSGPSCHSQRRGQTSPFSQKNCRYSRLPRYRQAVGATCAFFAGVAMTSQHIKVPTDSKANCPARTTASLKFHAGGSRLSLCRAI
jgi:hypothetical protein